MFRNNFNRKDGSNPDVSTRRSKCN